MQHSRPCRPTLNVVLPVSSAPEAAFECVAGRSTGLPPRHPRSSSAHRATRGAMPRLEQLCRCAAVGKSRWALRSSIRGPTAHIMSSIWLVGSSLDFPMGVGGRGGGRVRFRIESQPGALTVHDGSSLPSGIRAAAAKGGSCKDFRLQASVGAFLWRPSFRAPGRFVAPSGSRKDSACVCRRSTLGRQEPQAVRLDTLRYSHGSRRAIHR